MGDAVLLDRPDEVLSGIGFDFPVNKYFQVIAEAASHQVHGWPNAKRFPQQSS